MASARVPDAVTFGVDAVPAGAGAVMGRPAAERSASVQLGPVAAAPAWVPGRRCSIGFDQSFVTAAGEVVPCCFSDEHMGRLDEASFDQIWNGARYAAFRRRLISGDFASYCISNRCSLPGVLQK